MSLVEVKNVSFTYPNGFVAVDGVSFKLEKGENIAIVGQNGAGKTTTVKMLNGLTKPTSGDIIVDGKNTKEYTTAQIGLCVPEPGRSDFQQHRLQGNRIRAKADETAKGGAGAQNYGRGRPHGHGQIPGPESL